MLSALFQPSVLGAWKNGLVEYQSLSSAQNANGNGQTELTNQSRESANTKTGPSLAPTTEQRQQPPKPILRGRPGGNQNRPMAHSKEREL
jgi:hypothetical protein